ncbi:MAG: radical SAM protein, partial [Candidatus Zixiibacteriota bacterium]
MARCTNCGEESTLISRALQVCLDCIREDFGKVSSRIHKVHAKSRAEFDLPAEPPKESSGVKCNLCVNECGIPEGERGYCGLRKNESG